MTPAVVQGLALAWLAVISVIVIAVIPVGLVVIKGWQTWRAALDPKVTALTTTAIAHDVQLNGSMTNRITAGVTAGLAAQQTGVPVPAVASHPVDGGVVTDPVKAARIAALQAELTALQA
jgi:hypothetical protein